MCNCYDIPVTKSLPKLKSIILNGLVDKDVLLLPGPEQQAPGDDPEAAAAGVALVVSHPEVLENVLSFPS